MGPRRVAIARAKLGGGDVIMRQGDVHLGLDRRLLGLEPFEEPAESVLVVAVGGLRVAAVDQLVGAELLEREEHVAMGLGLVRLVDGDLAAELQGRPEVLASGLRVAE